MSSSPNQKNEICNIFISLFWHRGEARCWAPPLNTQFLQKLMDGGERGVFILGFFCLPCYMRATVWSWKKNHMKPPNDFCLTMFIDMTQFKTKRYLKSLFCLSNLIYILILVQSNIQLNSFNRTVSIVKTTWHNLHLLLYKYFYNWKYNFFIVYHIKAKNASSLCNIKGKMELVLKHSALPPHHDRVWKLGFNYETQVIYCTNKNQTSTHKRSINKTSSWSVLFHWRIIRLS